MDFELAQLLQAAGWPQGGAGKWVVDPASIVGRKRVYQPTLEELIEGCGPHLTALRQSGGRWTASAEHARVSGRTPVEAVARLWLQLEDETVRLSSSPSARP
jgi:hypothetical protein